MMAVRVRAWFKLGDARPVNLLIEDGDGRRASFALAMDEVAGLIWTLKRQQARFQKATRRPVITGRKWRTT